MSDYYWIVAVNVSLMEEQTVLPYSILIGDDYNERTFFLFFFFFWKREWEREYVWDNGREKMYIK